MKKRLRHRLDRLAVRLFSGAEFISKADQALEGINKRGNKTIHKSV